MPELSDDWAKLTDWQGPVPQSQPFVTLANWQEHPHQEWAFQHMRELMPSHGIDATDSPRELIERSVDLAPIKLDLDWAATFGDLIDQTATDAIAVFHHGELIYERYFNTMHRRRRHLVMSVSKSIVSSVAGSLVADGLLDPEAPVETYVPELAQSGYAGARVRTLLDMRSGIKFAETYLDPQSEVRVMERSMGWAPRMEGDPLGMYSYILTIEPEGAHDDVFDYRSIDTDTLGWVCERAAKLRMADLVSARVWQPIGAHHDAEITVDPLGFAIHDGGVSATLRDLGRLGLMWQDYGKVGGHQVIPAHWIEATLAPPPDVRDAFARSVNEPYMPGSWYRNQFWVSPGPRGPIMLALGIHGQMVYVDHAAELVGVKLSSWSTPQDSTALRGTISGFTKVADEFTA